MPAPLPDELRVRVVQASDELGVLQAAKLFSVGEASVKRWRSRLRRTGRVTASPMGGDRKSGAKTAAAVAEAVDEKPDRTLREVAAWLVTRLGRLPALSTIGGALRRAGFARRRKVIVAKERSTQRWRDARAAFMLAAAMFDPKRLVFIDESGVERGMVRRDAWRRRGSVVVDRVVRNRGTVTTVISAMSPRGIIATMYGEGATTAEVFRAFVVHCLVPELRPGDIVVLDNLGAHKAKGIAELVEATGARLVYLPPYSPELNPIECAWAKMKTLLRTARPETLAELHEAVSRALDAITSHDAIGWFGHCGYGLPAAA